MADEQTDSLLDAALDTSKDDDSYVLDEHSGEEGETGEDAVRILCSLGRSLGHASFKFQWLSTRSMMERDINVL